MKFPAKLLLFGEHTVNAGSQALAVPFWHFSGQWRFLPAEKLDGRHHHQQELPAFAEHLFRLLQTGQLAVSFQVEKFRQDLAEGLFFDADIPTGYGAGSSGALVAAVAERYAHLPQAKTPEDLAGLQRTFAQLEGFFHGTSSGTDPLVCWLQAPVLLGQAGPWVVAPAALDSHQFFLLDTGQARQATPFIQYFLQQNEDPAFRQRMTAELLPAVDAGIAAYLAGNGKNLWQEVHRIGAFQYSHLKKLIPPVFHAWWQEGLAGQRYKLKVCGAGGGGFILGLTPDLAAVQDHFAPYRVLPVGGDRSRLC